MTNERPFILCLTGSLGMGKSRTASFFAEQSGRSMNSDAAVHALYAGEAVPLIESAFSANVACPRPRASWRRTTEVTRDHELRSVRLVIKCDV